MLEETKVERNKSAIFNYMCTLKQEEIELIMNS